MQARTNVMSGGIPWGSLKRGSLKKAAWIRTGSLIKIFQDALNGQAFGGPEPENPEPENMGCFIGRPVQDAPSHPATKARHGDRAAL
ncbi:hypothetical protein BGC30_05265 [Novacetimonas hansenii]|nr:hypothetical protein BGC30_05265 [Novacetimonas hansenii]